ncbi:uncharacterized protein LOC111243121 [Varroa destructor]|uniref:C2 domain-containing protein n=1 Tax=Varroa destructor TaxID=109461 RepID=A0A7M7IXK2_VARDE|nr:uncharacterized protein LOC111243121 [Varroa destructor]
MPFRREGSSQSSVAPTGATAYASIRRSERLASKAAHLLEFDTIISSFRNVHGAGSKGLSNSTYRSFNNNIDQDRSFLNLEQVDRKSGVDVVVGLEMETTLLSPDKVNMNQSIWPVDGSILASDQKIVAMGVAEEVPMPNTAAAGVITGAKREFKRRNVRMSIRRSLRPLANILINGKKKKDNCHQRSIIVDDDMQKHYQAANKNRNMNYLMDDDNEFAHIDQNPPAAVMERRAHRNTICLASSDMNSGDTAIDSSVARPFPSDKLSCRMHSMNPHLNKTNIKCDNLHYEFRVPMVPPELPIFPKPLPRTSLLRQENVPPLPPPRRRSPRISQTLTKFRELEQLHNYEPSSILRLRELSTNPPKRKICLEPTVECAADDENSFVDWRAFAGTSGGYDTDRKRRKTVRFQNKSLGMLRGSELASGKAKLQLCLYINYGHLSVHVIRGANLPLLPDQHELNSYVKVALEPKDVRSQHRSQLVSGTVDPSYDFRLSFELSLGVEEDRSLLITVWHRDYITKQSRLLGFLNFAMKRIIEANRIEGWFRLPSLAITKKTRN